MDLALKADAPDGNPDLRIVGLRLARQLSLDMVPLVMRPEILSDSHGGMVQREGAISLRHSKSPGAPKAWTEIALRTSSSSNRWALEAIGIGADGQWDAFLDAYLKEMGGKVIANAHSQAVIWRSRAVRTPDLLTKIIQYEGVAPQDLPRFFRAFDFQKDSPIKSEALLKLAFGNNADPKRQSFITSEALARIKSLDLKTNPQQAAAVNKLLDQSRDTPMYVELVGKFNLVERYGSLLAIAQNQPDQQLGIDAMKLLLERDAKLALPGLRHPQINAALATVQAMGNAANVNANPLLLPIVQDAKADLELRRQATRALGRTKPGAQELIKLAQSKQLAKELEIAAGSILLTSSAKDIRAQAEKLFPQPTTKDKKPLPAISDLVKQKGNVGNGQNVFAKQGTCAKCHTVNGEGKNVGPDLSEIGKKLSREAVFESILYPSASILHNYETWVVETKQGTTTSGLLVSRTPTEVVIKDAEAIVRTFKTGEVDTVARSPISLMPADLHQAMTTQELVDVVEYLLTLREARKK